MSDWLSALDWPTIAGALALTLQVLLAAAVILRVVLTRHPPTSSLAWIILTVVLPYVGFLLYLLIGEKPIGRWRRFRIRETLDRWSEGAAQSILPMPDHLPAGQRHQGLVRLAQKLGGLPMTEGSRLELFSDSQLALESIIADIRAATSSVRMEFYIWNEGGLVERVGDALVDAAARGVECLVLLDAIGSREFLSGAGCQRLRQAGVKIAVALPARFFAPTHGRLDLRLHRKTIIIDQTIGYTGSLNMIDPRLVGPSEGVGDWIDAMARITGTAVTALNVVFSFDWALQPGDGEGSQFAPVAPAAPDGDARVVIVPSGPTASDDANMRLIIEAINCARRHLRLATPYFVPNEAMAIALQNAAYRGVRVELILPRRYDSRFVRWASQRYFEDLLAAGAEISRFDAGLIHTKAITVDDQFALFGTVNLDNRSLHLNFEMMILVFDAQFVPALVDLLDDYRRHSTPVDFERWRRRSLGCRLLEGFCHLLSPLL